VCAFVAVVSTRRRKRCHNCRIFVFVSSGLLMAFVIEEWLSMPETFLDSLANDFLGYIWVEFKSRHWQRGISQDFRMIFLTTVMRYLFLSCHMIIVRLW